MKSPSKQNNENLLTDKDVAIVENAITGSGIDPRSLAFEILFKRATNFLIDEKWTAKCKCYSNFDHFCCDISNA